MIQRAFVVQGRVQGVSYREYARRKALELGILGHALNHPDGSVHVLACGPAPAVETFASWLWQGSPWAAVSAVQELQSVASPQQMASDFIVGWVPGQRAGP